MFETVKRFLYDGQTFHSAMADLASLGAAIAASPAGQDYLNQLGGYGPLLTVAVAYVGGVVSGRRTNMTTPAATVA